MPTVEIKLSFPEGTNVQVTGLDAAQVSLTPSVEDPVERYFNDYLSYNGRKVFGTAARIEDFRGRPGFTLEDIAASLSVDYATVKSWHRTTGRAAKRWRRDTGTQEPIRFEWIDYQEFDDGAGARTAYRLPNDVAGVIRDLPIVQSNPKD